MISKALTKRILALHSKRAREKEGIFLVEGRKALLELAGETQKKGSPWQVEQFLLPENEPWANALKPSLLVPYQEADANTLAKLSTLHTNADGLAIVHSPVWTPFVPAKGQLYLALDGIRDPGNLGTLLRLADWFGIADVLASPDTCEWQNPKVVAASMGSYCRVRVHYGNLGDLLGKILVRYGALLEGPSSYQAQRPSETTVLIIGSESHGIGPEVLPLITHPISIPRLGQAESLNAAMAAGMLLYELTRPR